MTIPGVPYQNPLNYVGPQMNLVPIAIFYRTPTTTDKKYRIGSVVIIGKDPASGSQGDLWYLSRFDSSGDAIWLQFASGASDPGIDFILTDEGAPPVEPTSGGVVSILGTTGIVTRGSGGNTVTIYGFDFTTDSGTATPASSTLTVTGTGGITTSGAAATLTIDGSGVENFNWIVVTDATDDLVANQGVFANRGAGVTLTLPTTAAVGDSFQVVAMDAGGFVIDYGTDQLIQVGNTATTTTTGSITSTGIGDWVELVCNVADTSFFANVKQGNVTLV